MRFNIRDEVEKRLPWLGDIVNWTYSSMHDGKQFWIEVRLGCQVCGEVIYKRVKICAYTVDLLCELIMQAAHGLAVNCAHASSLLNIVQTF